MLSEIPSSFVSLLSLFRPCFTRPTFQTFCALSVGLLTRVRARTVTGMLAAAGLAGVWHHSRAHRFFSRARCRRSTRAHRPGARRQPARERERPLVIAIDDTLIKRFGPKVFGRHLNYDGSSQAGGPKSMRTAWATAGWCSASSSSCPFSSARSASRCCFGSGGPARARPKSSSPASCRPRRRSPSRSVRGLPRRCAYAGSALAPAKVPENVTLVSGRGATFASTDRRRRVERADGSPAASR